MINQGWRMGKIQLKPEFDFYAGVIRQIQFIPNSYTEISPLVYFIIGAYIVPLARRPNGRMKKGPSLEKPR